MKQSTVHLADCNRCGHKNCKSIGRQYDPCPIHIDPSGTFMLAELVLEHPQSLNDALSALPFDTDLSFTLK